MNPIKNSNKCRKCQKLLTDSSSFVLEQKFNYEIKEGTCKECVKLLGDSFTESYHSKGNFFEGKQCYSWEKPFECEYCKK